MSFRIVVNLDIETQTAADAYAAVRLDFSKSLPRGFVYETTEEWYDSNGDRMSPEAVADARNTAQSVHRLALEAYLEEMTNPQPILVCPDCGCESIEVTRWLKLNENLVVGKEAPIDSAYCPDCDDTFKTRHLITRDEYHSAKEEEKPTVAVSPSDEAIAQYVMKPSEIREQNISFAFGNLAIDRPHTKRDVVEQAMTRMLKELGQKVYSHNQISIYDTGKTGVLIELVFPRSGGPAYLWLPDEVGPVFLEWAKKNG